MAVTEARHDKTPFRIDVLICSTGEVVGRGAQNRATPLAAGGGTRDVVVGGVVLGASTHNLASELCDETVFNDKIGIM